MVTWAILASPSSVLTAEKRCEKCRPHLEEETPEPGFGGGFGARGRRPAPRVDDARPPRLQRRAGLRHAGRRRRHRRRRLQQRRPLPAPRPVAVTPNRDRVSQVHVQIRQRGPTRSVSILPRQECGRSTPRPLLVGAPRTEMAEIRWRKQFAVALAETRGRRRIGLSLPGASLLTWTILAVVNWYFDQCKI